MRERRPSARSARHAVEHIDAYLSACRIGITVAHVVLGELAPKSAAIARTGPVVLVLAPPMRTF